MKTGGCTAGAMTANRDNDDGPPSTSVVRNRRPVGRFYSPATLTQPERARLAARARHSVTH
jgi:hypothetical protein